MIELVATYRRLADQLVPLPPASQIFRTPNKEVRAQLEIDELLHETRYAVVKLNDRTKLSVATLYVLQRRMGDEAAHSGAAI